MIFLPTLLSLYTDTHIWFSHIRCMVREGNVSSRLCLSFYAPGTDVLSTARLSCLYVFSKNIFIAHSEMPLKIFSRSSKDDK